MSDGRDGGEALWEKWAPSDPPVTLMVENPKDLPNETGPGEQGAGGPGGALGCFSWPSQRCALVLRKVQIRKALGNEGWPERITQQPGVGPRNAACGDGLAERVK